MGHLHSLLAAARTALLGPVWAAQLLTGSKSFMDNPLIGSRRLNAWGLHGARVRLAGALAASRRRRLAGLIGEEDRAAFDRDGYVVKRDFLPPELFAALNEQVAAYRGEAREQMQGDTLTRHIPLCPATRRGIPALKGLLQLPGWRGLIAYAGSFDAAPMVYIQTVLNQPGAGAADPQLALHAGTFHATVKAWLFLTDVDPDALCFTYVPGSHPHGWPGNATRACTWGPARTA